MCKPDYSDIATKIDWAINNRDACREIGANAKKLFVETCNNISLINWIKKVIDE
jgi:hypothetical protein